MTPHRKMLSLAFAIPLLILFFDGGSPSAAPVDDEASGDGFFGDTLSGVYLADSSPLPAAPSDPFEDMPLDVVYAGDSPAGTAGAALSGRVSFRVEIGDLIVPYPLLAVTALPGEVLEVSVSGHGEEDAPRGIRLRSGEGLVPEVSAGRWRWRAPDAPGVYPVRVESPGDGASVHLNVIVLHPFNPASERSLNGYRIGEYRTAPGRTSPPEGFIEGNSEVLDLLVSPHFTLGQFLCKQTGDPPYLALSEPLLLKLEAILEEVRDSGIDAETLYVMSAFRTPYYNRAIGNTTDASRHLWGDAADIFIDTTGNGWMDDLDGDGRVDEADARVLYRIVERVEARAEPHVRAGGLSLYRPNAVRGPFLHVDTRGVPARW